MIASEQALAGAAVEIPVSTGRPIATNSPVLTALTFPGMYRGHPAVEVHETHASWMFLAGSFACKVKKPVRLASLDYSTLARRRAARQEEVRVNRELAPGIYIGVRAIVRADERQNTLLDW